MLVGYTLLYVFVIDPFIGRVTGLQGDPFAPPYDRGEMLIGMVSLPRGWIFLLVSAALVGWFVLNRMPADEFTTGGNRG